MTQRRVRERFVKKERKGESSNTRGWGRWVDSGGFSSYHRGDRATYSGG